MEMDLEDKTTYDQSKYEEYILGSAEVVGLMCLKVFVNGDQDEI
jgi:phytoene synthase